MLHLSFRISLFHFFVINGQSRQSNRFVYICVKFTMQNVSINHEKSNKSTENVFSIDHTNLSKIRCDWFGWYEEDDDDDGFCTMYTQRQQSVEWKSSIAGRRINNTIEKKKKKSNNDKME